MNSEDTDRFAALEARVAALEKMSTHEEVDMTSQPVEVPPSGASVEATGDAASSDSGISG